MECSRLEISLLSIHHAGERRLVDRLITQVYLVTCTQKPDPKMYMISCTSAAQAGTAIQQTLATSTAIHINL